ncbi:CLUMA_CG010488, isoform A [Clunio marinus]|uniref:CLUMA_CG010488, isoform A n=1 Tax=Clunio marinus TaxID=568069 RepID=A0A1J1I9T7_9DIPT|nr:CLUMA_CG010488, isoform A [Clunio marinus]
MSIKCGKSINHRSYDRRSLQLDKKNLSRKQTTNKPMRNPNLISFIAFKAYAFGSFKLVNSILQTKEINML